MSLGPLMIDLKGPALDDEERAWLLSPVVGGVILFARNFEDPEQLAALVAEIHEARSPSLLVAVDQEGGRVQRFREPFTVLPPMRSLGHLYDEDAAKARVAARAFGWLMAAELRAVDIDLSFAPVVDLDLGLAEVIGDRALHPDATIVSELVIEFAEGAQAAGMAVVAKHFPTHAGAVNDSHTNCATDGRTYNDLWGDLDPYRHLVGAGLPGVMVGHVSFPEVDPSPASFSSWWIREQLRGQLGFSGAVLSDDVTMEGAAPGGTCSERAVKAVEAGCDMVLVCNAPGEIPATIDALADYVSPSSQLHLIRLRGRHREDWDSLRSSEAWQGACQQVAQLTERPGLELEG